MGILAWIIVGLIVGVIAKAIMPGPDPGGMIVTILLGIGGALLGGAIGRGLGFYTVDEPAGWLMSIVGAVVILAGYRAIFRRRATI
jgi:uncharacterized membrane protein YeaQ/YmgE (transglycosylase-associated protein family)